MTNKKTSPSKTFAYVRVSTTEQNTDRQLDALRQYVSNERDIFIDINLSGILSGTGPQFAHL